MMMFWTQFFDFQSQLLTSKSKIHSQILAKSLGHDMNTILANYYITYLSSCRSLGLTKSLKIAFLKTSFLQLQKLPPPRAFIRLTPSFK